MALVDIEAAEASSLRRFYDVEDLNAWVFVRDGRSELLRAFSADDEGGSCSLESAAKFGATLTAAIRAALTRRGSLEDCERAFQAVPDRRNFDALVYRYEESDLELRLAELITETRRRSGLPPTLERAARMMALAQELRRIGHFKSGADPSMFFREIAELVAAEPGSGLARRLMESAHFALVDEFNLFSKQQRFIKALIAFRAQSTNPEEMARLTDTAASKLDEWLRELDATPSNAYRVVPLGRPLEARQVLDKMRPLYVNGDRLLRLIAEAEAAAKK